MIFGHTYQNSLALSGTWYYMYMNVCGQPHTTPALPLGKMPWVLTAEEAALVRDLASSPVEVENLLTLPEPNLNYSFIYPVHSLLTTPTTPSQLPF